MKAYMLAATRSPVAPRGGALAHLGLADLGAPVLNAALRQAGIDAAQVDELIVSNAMGGGGNPARLIGLAAGLPDTVAGLSIDRQCAGGLDALLLAARLVQSGAADVVIAGGVESYSRRPQRFATDPGGGPPRPYDQPPFTPWPERDPDMAQAADRLARDQGIDRARQDGWACDSHRKALASPVPPGEITALAGLDHDAFARPLNTRIAARAPVVTGTITAANMAVAADAAAFCVIVSERIIRARGGQTHAPVILGGVTRGATPDQPGTAPIAATRDALSACGMSPSDLDHIEVMEAFAVQAIACVQGAGLDPACVNRGGGALARGHPIGASGTINAVRLWHDMKTHAGGTGLATIAAAGGIATTLILGA
ncbi:thiolase family protein [Sulfitobacter sp. S190]|uniref:thiolase family protein n=1 Tax=Sulfitobacter sp. S190 TaxID=2867022 RepID=UPI0021A693D2|nr:thiolase family protein [Sulfitobacter sp. S190]UWR22817.1 thiolase family protein [Sulfitobacter sp. S190]